jgi:ABC-2 type transport system permease protein
MIKTEFTGSMDTLSARNKIRKTVLLRTSDFSNQVQAPVLIGLEEVRLTPQQQEFTDRFLPVAVLLEGKFESAFRNRMISALFIDTAISLKENSLTTSMLVVADADIIRNDVSLTPQGALISPLGFDRFTQQTFGNKEFVVNSIQYMTGKAGLINLRSRELTMRLLDKMKVAEGRRKWAVINTVCPPLLVIIAGLLYSRIRKRLYSGL